MKSIKRVVIMPNRSRDKGYLVTKRVCGIIMRNTQVFMSDKYEESEIDGVTYFGADFFPEDADLIIVIGGDGSVLDAGRYAIEHEIPLLGINKGRLGYLTQLEESQLSSLTRLAQGEYEIQERMLLSVSYGDRSELCMNDFVFTHKNVGELICYEINDGGKSSLEYSSDSLVIATPSGSTGYSMSGGGPILDVAISAMCVTPVSAHSIFSRSMIFGADKSVKITNISDREVDISMMADGRVLADIKPSESVTVSASKRKVSFLSIDGMGTLDKLCQKMKFTNVKVK